MTKDYLVQIPDIPGKIVTRARYNATYVFYEIGREYKKEKHYNVPKRVIIGKVSNDDPAMMYPNDNFEMYFPDRASVDMLPPAYRSNCLSFGTYAVIKKILCEYDIPDMLYEYVGEDTGLLLDLVSYLIISEENAAQHYGAFAFGHPLFSEKMRIFSDSKICRFFQSITEDTSIGFLNAWNADRDHHQRLYISYDSTNKTGEAGDIDLLEYGHSKDNADLPIFNFAIAYDMNNKVPLLYEVYSGSIPDVTEFSAVVDKVKAYGYKRIGFVLDRGYFSKPNIQYMDENNYEFIMMVKGCKELVSSLVESYRGTFEDERKNYIPAFQVFGTTSRCRLYKDDTKDRYFHLFYDSVKYNAERKKLMADIDKKEENLKKHEGTVIINPKYYAESFILHNDKEGRLLFAETKDDAIKRKLQLCGYFCIITSEKMTAKEALTKYKNRDESEKLFSQDKTFIGSRSMRVQTDVAMKAKIFVEFIALIVRNRMYILLKDEMARLPKKPNYMTVPAAIRELEKIQVTRRNNGIYVLENSLSARQKKILSAFGISDADIRKDAINISALLRDDKSLLDEEAMNDDDDDDFDDLFGEGADIEMEDDL